MSKKSSIITPLPTTVGARQVSKTFRNILLSREATDFLVRIGGTLRIEYTHKGKEPLMEIVDRQGETLAQLSEFEELANYKTFVRKIKEEVDNNRNSDLVNAIFYNAKMAYENLYGMRIPERMLESNSTKFGSLRRSIEIIEKNLAVITTLPESDEKSYLIRQGTVLQQLYIRGLIDCLGPNKYEQDVHDERLLGLGVPKYLDGRFTDPTYAKDVKTDARPLLFPKGNFMKGLSFQTREIASDSFMRANCVMARHSHSIIQLAKSEALRDWFINANHSSRDELLVQWGRISWPMLAIIDYLEYLTPRRNRVNVKTFTPIQTPTERPGMKGFRPETPFQREIRDLKNQVGKFQSTLLDFHYLIPRVEEPIRNFWSHFFETDQWDILPDKMIYDYIYESPRRDHVVNAIANNGFIAVRRHKAKIIGMQMGIPGNCLRHRQLEEIICNTGLNDIIVDYPDDPPRSEFERELLEVTPDELRNTTSVTNAVRKQITTFRGKETLEAQASKKTNNSAVGMTKLGSEARGHLEGLGNGTLRESIRKWIIQHFRHPKVQATAAEFAVMAVSEELDDGNDSDEESSSGDW